mmetsp:Transcript_51643/g.117743  ORF Transcript_51643/g.117743 Transcript_51643/m.117743 type:complete len:88 (+) Transcript_51643:976-1239(+)
MLATGRGDWRPVEEIAQQIIGVSYEWASLIVVSEQCSHSSRVRRRAVVSAAVGAGSSSQKVSAKGEARDRKASKEERDELQCFEKTH